MLDPIEDTNLEPTFTKAVAARVATGLAGACLLLLAAGCTTYSWPDGRSETLFGVPPSSQYQEDRPPHETPLEYRVPGEVPET